MGKEHLSVPGRRCGKSFLLGRIVRKQVCSAKSGQIFKPLALIKVGSCDSVISYVLFIMAMYLNTNAFQKLHSHAFFWKVLETVCSSKTWWVDTGWMPGTHQSLSIIPLHNWIGERKYRKVCELR